MNIYRPTWAYRIFKAYVKWGESLYYHHIYLENDDLVRHYNPDEGNILMAVSNHNNTAQDAICAVLRFPNNCKVYSVARADAFAVSPILEKVFYWIGMTPAYRTEFGVAEDQVKRNYELFDFTSEQMAAGCPLVLFPEGIHHEEHYLNEWFVNYCRIAFMAAERTGYERDVLIIPSCNDWDDYFGYHVNFMIRYGEPVNLRDYYELYKTKPRTAQREVNKIVLGRVKAMMLNVEDHDNYWAIDWLRQSEWGRQYARQQGFDPDILPQKHDADRQLVGKLSQVEDREALQAVYDEALQLRDEEQRMGISERSLELRDGVITTEMNLIWLIVSLPIWLLAAVPGAVQFYLPRHFAAFDKMYTGSIIFIANMLVLLPVLWLLMLLVPGLGWGLWLPALIWVAVQPLCWRFAWHQGKTFVRTLQALRRLCHPAAVRALDARRKALFARLESLLAV